MRIIVTTTWNSADVIMLFLHHYKKLGFDKVLVMDFNSNDGTKEILTDPCWNGFVSLQPFPGLLKLDSSNLMLEHAHRTMPKESLCFFCDPDELLVLPSMDVTKDIPLDLGSPEISSWVVPRFNVTCKRSMAETCQFDMHALGTLVYRANGTLREETAPLIDKDKLEPAWIFTRIPGKVLSKLQDTKKIDSGDHAAQAAHGVVDAPEGVYLQHYPFRTTREFEKKIKLAKHDFETNSHLPLGYGWQLRRWIRQMGKGMLGEEYLEQFPADDAFARLLETGELVKDTAILDFHIRK